MFISSKQWAETDTTKALKLTRSNPKHHVPSSDQSRNICSASKHPRNLPPKWPAAEDTTSLHQPATRHLWHRTRSTLEAQPNHHYTHPQHVWARWLQLVPPVTDIRSAPPPPPANRTTNAHSSAPHQQDVCNPPASTQSAPQTTHRALALMIPLSHFLRFPASAMYLYLSRSACFCTLHICASLSSSACLLRAFLSSVLLSSVN
jgi:hypothetical protein